MLPVPTPWSRMRRQPRETPWNCGQKSASNTPRVPTTEALPMATRLACSSSTTRTKPHSPCSLPAIMPTTSASPTTRHRASGQAAIRFTGKTRRHPSMPTATIPSTPNSAALRPTPSAYSRTSATTLRPAAICWATRQATSFGLRRKGSTPQPEPSPCSTNT